MIRLICRVVKSNRIFVIVQIVAEAGSVCDSSLAPFCRLSESRMSSGQITRRLMPNEFVGKAVKPFFVAVPIINIKFRFRHSRLKPSINGFSVLRRSCDRDHLRRDKKRCCWWWNVKTCKNIFTLQNRRRSYYWLRQVEIFEASERQGCSDQVLIQPIKQILLSDLHNFKI